MKKYIMFNLIVQLIILFFSAEYFYFTSNIKFLYSLFIIGIIFIPTILETALGIKIKTMFHYLTTFFCLLLFIILIAF